MIPTILNGKYEIRHPLAESHLYEIFAGVESETATAVVVKVLREEMCINPERAKTFTDEVRAFAALSHPAAAQVLDMDLVDGRPYVVTEMVEGQSLRTWMKEQPSSFTESLRVIQQIAALLQYATAQQVQQRSIKSSNILRTPQGAIKVLSFSFPRLKLVGARQTEEAAGVQSDLFFCGTTLYEMLTGESPIRKRGGINEHWDTRLRQSIRIRHPQLSPEKLEAVVGFIERTFIRNVQQRFADHGAFLMGLSDLQHSGEEAVRKDREQSRRQLASAAEVVDAIHGRLAAVAGGGSSSVTMASAGGGSTTPLRLVSDRGTRMGAASAAAAAETEESEDAPTVDESMFAAEDDQTTGDGDHAAGDSSRQNPGAKAYGSGKPRLTLVKGGRKAEGSSIWKASDDVSRLRQPLVLMGSLLALMVLLILFW